MRCKTRLTDEKKVLVPSWTQDSIGTQWQALETALPRSLNRGHLAAASTSAGVVGSPLGAADIPSVINIAPSQTQAAAQRSGTAPGGALPTSTRPTNPVGLNFSTPYLQGSILQAFNNFTFNYSECYSDSPSIRVTLQNQAVRDDFPDEVYQAYFEVYRDICSRKIQANSCLAQRLVCGREKGTLCLLSYEPCRTRRF